MAFKIAGIEPVELGDKQCKPRLDADKRLRLAEIKFSTQAEKRKAVQVIASCFPEDEEFVTEFLTEEAGDQDLQLLALYLRGGQNALNAYQQAYDKLMADVVAKAQEEANAND